MMIFGKCNNAYKCIAVQMVHRRCNLIIRIAIEYNNHVCINNIAGVKSETAVLLCTSEHQLTGMQAMTMPN